MNVITYVNSFYKVMAFTVYGVNLFQTLTDDPPKVVSRPAYQPVNLLPDVSHSFPSQNLLPVPEDSELEDLLLSIDYNKPSHTPPVPVSKRPRIEGPVSSNSSPRDSQHLVELKQLRELVISFNRQVAALKQENDALQYRVYQLETLFAAEYDTIQTILKPPAKFDK